METMYKVTLYVSKFMRLGEDNYQTVEVPKELTFSNWDDVQNFISYMVEGSKSPVKTEIEEIKED